MKKIFINLVLATGFLLATDNAAAAIARITTPVSITDDTIYLKYDGTNLIVSDGSSYVLRMSGFVFMDADIYLGDHNSNYTGDGFTPGSVSADTIISSSLTYNGNYSSSTLPNSAYYGFKYGTGSDQSPQYHYGWVNLTMSSTGSSATLTLNSAAINTTPGESILAGQTAVPEPSTFIPAAVLVAGALLRRRRPRSHRSGRATA